MLDLQDQNSVKVTHIEKHYSRKQIMCKKNIYHLMRKDKCFLADGKMTSDLSTAAEQSNFFLLSAWIAN